MSAPSLLYLTRLQLEEGGVIGASVPGTPIILSGRNKKLAWGITASYLDDQDIFIEEQNLSNPNLYRTDNGWAEFKSDVQYIKVKNLPEVKIKRNWTKNGPVLPSSVFDLTSITPRHHVATLSWTGLTETDTTISSAIDLMLSQNVRQGLFALEKFYAPSLNFLLVDEEIMSLKTVGKMPTESQMKVMKAFFDQLDNNLSGLRTNLAGLSFLKQ